MIMQADVERSKAARLEAAERAKVRHNCLNLLRPAVSRWHYYALRISDNCICCYDAFHSCLSFNDDSTYVSLYLSCQILIPQLQAKVVHKFKESSR